MRHSGQLQRPSYEETDPNQEPSGHLRESCNLIIPCAKHSTIFILQTDDYGVFETTLSQEFEIATKSFELTGKDLERILLESVQHAFCSDSEKLNLAEQIGKYFGEILLRETK